MCYYDSTSRTENWYDSRSCQFFVNTKFMETLKQLRHKLPEELALEGIKCKVGDNIYCRITSFMEKYRKLALERKNEELKRLIVKLYSAGKTTSNNPSLK